MKENTAEYVILGIISAKPRTGYEIRKMVKLGFGDFWDLGYSQIYPTLRRMENSGYVTKKVVINENRPNRKVYSITEKGIIKLKAWLMKPAKHETFKAEVLLKVSFGEKVPIEYTIQQVEALKERHLIQLKNAVIMETEMKAHLNSSERLFFGLLVLELGKNLHETLIQWADAAIEKLKEK